MPLVPFESGKTGGGSLPTTGRKKRKWSLSLSLAYPYRNITFDLDDYGNKGCSQRKRKKGRVEQRRPLYTAEMSVSYIFYNFPAQ
jgi:hypothetical protein